MEPTIISQALGIRYIDLRFTLIIQKDSTLPKYKTSALRGGMGQMLLKQNCIRDKQCESCDFVNECLVRRMMYSKYEIQPKFATRGDSIGYVIECNNLKESFRSGEKLEFHLLIYGKTIAYFSQFLQAFYMLGQYGLGKEYVRYEIVKVENDRGEIVVSGNNVYLSGLGISTIKEYVDMRRNQIESLKLATMHFLTPTTLKYQGEFLQRFHAEAILRSVSRRLYSFDCFEGNSMPLLEIDEKLPEIVKQKTHYVSIPRYSSTMQGKMSLKGIKGYVVFDDLSENFLTMLLAGEKLHIGKNTSFGFGKYVMGEEMMNSDRQLKELQLI